MVIPLAVVSRNDHITTTARQPNSPSLTEVCTSRADDLKAPASEAGDSSVSGGRFNTAPADTRRDCWDASVRHAGATQVASGDGTEVGRWTAKHRSIRRDLHYIYAA